MVSSELGLANNVYHLKSIMNINFILSCKRSFSDVLEGVILKVFLGASPQTPIFPSLHSVVHPHFLVAGAAPDYISYRITLQYELHYITYRNDSTILLQRCPEEQQTVSTPRPLDTKYDQRLCRVKRFSMPFRLYLLNSKS